MRRCSQPVEQACTSQYECAGADGENDLSLCSLILHPIQQILIQHFAAGAEATGNDQDIDLRKRFEAVLGDYLELVPRGDGAGTFCNGKDVERIRAVAAAGDREDLEGARKVEDLHVIE